MSLRNVIALPGLIFIGLIIVFYILLFRYDLIRQMDLAGMVQIVTEQNQVLEFLPDLVSVVFYLFLFKILFL